MTMGFEKARAMILIQRDRFNSNQLRESKRAVYALIRHCQSFCTGWA